MTNIELDEAACGMVMERYGFRSKRDAVNFALRQVAIAPRSPEERELDGRAAALRGLEDLRAGRLLGPDELGIRRG